MKIYKDGEMILDLPREPKNYDGRIVRGEISLAVSGEYVKVARYTPERASEVNRALLKAYLDNEDEFNLPKE